MSKDNLGDRMKSYYEDRTKTYLPRRSNVIIRIDGCHFHTFTKGLDKPFDPIFIEAMQRTTKDLCERIQGVKLGYVQSDEISLLLTDYDSIETESWFDYAVQKMCSVSASIASMCFNKNFMDIIDEQLSDLKSKPARLQKLLEKVQLGAYFDSRCFIIPTEEVCNYFIWRENDAIRNSVSGLAQANFSQKQLNGKSQVMMKDMLKEKGIIYEDIPLVHQRGTCIVRKLEKIGDIERYKWNIDKDIPLFTEDRNYVENALPTK